MLESLCSIDVPFTSRSSAGTLPLTINNQIRNLGVSEGHANLAGSLGTSIAKMAVQVYIQPC